MGRVIRSLGPAIGPGAPVEAMRAGLGALLGLGVAGLFLMSPLVDLRLGLYLIAPFGATSVLVFAVPNSPLAQPWSAVVGNTSAAVIGVLCCMLVPDPALRIALAVGLAIVAMIPLRAIHPPAGAVAMTAAQNPEAIGKLGFWFALAPVAAGTLILIVVGVAYARATGRNYPFRQFDDPSSHGTADHAAPERLGLSKDELAGILQRTRQSQNVGVEDLSRLIGAAELQAASHQAGPLTAGMVMSRDLVTVGPETHLDQVADLFRDHGFTSIPVVEEGDKFLGIIYQIDLIRRARADAFSFDQGFGKSMSALVRRDRKFPVLAGEVMRRNVPNAKIDSGAYALLPLLAGGGCDAVPILHRGRIRGIVTQTDLLSGLARQAVRPLETAV
ncbi:CBS domain-containing protein [Paracoccus aestuariivivens]|uniref:CBS domain-containing protein n=2 Tax=Paracoccus aestuariivivens TaxID=1820333 RepID=A0A6L6J8H1_9RHOB|nr:CBS domain-containing protein [Paracoccus aestuariivivens]